MIHWPVKEFCHSVTGDLSGKVRTRALLEYKEREALFSLRFEMVTLTLPECWA